MSVSLQLTVIVITLNEEENIARCLRSVQWADEIIVVDSGSTDQTKEIAVQLSAKVLLHAWEGYGQQKNWAMKQSKNSWILFLDADEEVSAELAKEIQDFVSRADAHRLQGARLPRKTWYLGRWILYGGWYPNALVRLAKKDSAQWTEPAVHEELKVSGEVQQLQYDLYHYTFADVGDQVQTNIRFSRLGAQKARALGEKGSIFKILVKPIFKFLETYVWKRGFLDGLPGFVISVNASHSIFMKYVELRFGKDTHC